MGEAFDPGTKKTLPFQASNINFRGAKQLETTKKIKSKKGENISIGDLYRTNYNYASRISRVK